MPDDNTKRGKAERGRIDIDEEYKLRDWSKRLGVSPEKLKETVEKVGPRPADVTRELRNMPPVVENLQCPELFADRAIGFFLHAGVVTITLTSMRADHAGSPGSISQRVVARLTLPVAGAQGLAAGLYDFLKKQDLDPVPIPSDQPVQ